MSESGAYARTALTATPTVPCATAISTIAFPTICVIDIHPSPSLHRPCRPPHCPPRRPIAAPVAASVGTPISPAAALLLSSPCHHPLPLLSLTKSKLLPQGLGCGSTSTLSIESTVGLHTKAYKRDTHEPSKTHESLGALAELAYIASER